MALGRFQQRLMAGDTVSPAVSAEFLVIDAETGLKSVLFSDIDGETEISNPVTSDSDGFVAFYVKAGRLDFIITHPNGNLTINDYLIVDPDSAAPFNPDYPGMPTDDEGGGGDVWIMSEQWLGTGDSSPGAGIRDMAADSNGVVIALTRDAYASRSIDFGATWTALPRGIVTTGTQGEAVHTDGDGVFIASFFGGRYARSVDSGANWTELPLDLGLPAGSQGFGFDNVESIWICFQGLGYVARSTDSGATWSALPRKINNGNPGGTNSSTNIVALTMSSTGVALSSDVNGYMSRSTDFGATWTEFQRGIVDGGLEQGARIATDNNGVWVAINTNGIVFRSDDDAQTFTQVDSIGDTSFLTYGGRGVYLAGGNDGFVYRSDDNGLTFNFLSPRGLNSGSTTETIQNIATDGAANWYSAHDDGWSARSLADS